MKKNIIVFIILTIFTFVWSYGISYTNRLIAKKNIESQEVSKKEDVLVEYEGESYSEIAKKIDRNFSKDSKTFKVNEVEKSINGYGEYIAKYSISKGVDPYLIGAIMMVNSNCTIRCNEKVQYCNNISDLVGGDNRCFGGAYTKYSTIEESIKDLVDYVNNTFYLKEIKNPYDMYKTYDKDINWAYKVKKYMSALKK